MSKNTPETPETPEATAKTFDLAEWISGLAPTTRDYELAGVTFTVQALTKTARDKYLEDTKDAEDSVRRDLDFLALHIVSPEGVTGEDLKAINDVRGPEVSDMLALVVELDTKPDAMISPRFLRGASD